MSKKYFILILAAVAVVLAALFFIPKTQTVNVVSISPTPIIKEEKATLVLDYGDGNSPGYTVEINEDSTAFSVLKAISDKENIPLVTQQYDFGIFVKSIGGKESGADMAWIYHVNGESGTIAADKMKVNPGDTVEWKYIPPSE